MHDRIIVLNDPINLIDPYGLILEEAIEGAKKAEEAQKLAEEINNLILEKRKIFKCLEGGGPRPCDYKRLNEIELEIQKKRQEAIKKTRGAGKEVNKIMIEVIQKTINP